MQEQSEKTWMELAGAKIQEIHKGATGVYIIRCNANGKVYVGSAASSLGIIGRWKDHITRSISFKNKSVRFQNAWNKYGPKSFSFEVLEFCEPKSCIEREQYYIDLFRASDTRFGMNICRIAGNTLGLKRTTAQRKAASEHRKKFLTTRQGLDRIKSHSDYMKAFYATENGRLNRIESARKNSKSVIQMTRDGVFIERFASAFEAAEKTGAHNVAIGSCCNGRVSTAGGFRWKFSDGTGSSLFITKPSKSLKPVIQITTDGKVLTRFNSGAEAWRATGVHPVNISRCCRGNSGAAGGFRWVFAPVQSGITDLHNAVK